jgi:dTDP-4-dehydrorhamnose 3,5-epimerase
MIVREAPLPGIKVVDTRVFADARGKFRELWREEVYVAAGITGPFVQDNVSISRGGVLRGLHFQHPHGQGKLISVLEGTIWDVGVDVRRGSPGLGRWWGMEITAESGGQLYLPTGFAHGFVVLSETATVAYKCTAAYDPATEVTIAWDDPDIGIEWPITDPIISDKDRAGAYLRNVPEQRLPAFERIA